MIFTDSEVALKALESVTTGKKQQLLDGRIVENKGKLILTMVKS